MLDAINGVDEEKTTTVCELEPVFVLVSVKDAVELSPVLVDEGEGDVKLDVVFGGITGPGAVGKLMKVVVVGRITGPGAVGKLLDVWVAVIVPPPVGTLTKVFVIGGITGPGAVGKLLNVWVAVVPVVRCKRVKHVSYCRK